MPLVVKHPESSGSTSLEDQNDTHTTMHQVLIMNSQDIPSGSNHLLPKYYQVVTPKSPHDLSLLDDELDEVHHHSHISHVHKESEENERLKYEVAKREIMDQLNLQILIKHREMDFIESEKRKLDVQIEVLKILHEDKDLYSKIEMYQEELSRKTRLEYERRKLVLNRDNQSTRSQQSHINTKCCDSNFYYHTRSKGINTNNRDVDQLRIKGESQARVKQNEKSVNNDASSCLDSVDSFKTQLLNQHHRRNYSSTCVTSNSGVIGRDDKGDAIFKRPDGVLINITCCKCHRSGFTSAQGIVNHSRLKHFTTYSSQPLAILNNQILLPKEKQNQTIMNKFDELGLDPSKDYLPGVISSSISNLSPTRLKPNLRENQPSIVHKLNSTEVSTSTTSYTRIANKSTKRLERMYGKNDFQDVINYVGNAENDTSTIMKMDFNENNECENESLDDDHIINTETSGRGQNSLSITQDMDEKDKYEKYEVKHRGSKRRLKPAEKKARLDAISLVKLSKEDMRSAHYNLRAKSKLKGQSKYD